MERLNVHEATQIHDAVFVSSIRTYGNLGPFRPINRADFKGVRLFDLLLRPNQVICGSTVSAGDPDGALYGNWGVIVGSGDIQQAFPYDATSHVVDNRAISPYSWRNTDTDIRAQVARAIKYRMGHNEVDIALNQQSISGLFFGDHTSGVDGIDLPSQAVLTMIEPLEIPLYRLRNGSFFRLTPAGVPDSQSTLPRDIIEHSIGISLNMATYMKGELVKRLVLPPRNTISAGQQAGKAQLDSPRPKFQETMESHLNSFDIGHRYFGSMAVFAAQLTGLQSQTIFNEQVYRQLTERLHNDGTLSASLQDIDHYLHTGNTPDYLGEI